MEEDVVDQILEVSLESHWKKIILLNEKIFTSDSIRKWKNLTVGQEWNIKRVIQEFGNSELRMWVQRHKLDESIIDDLCCYKRDFIFYEQHSLNYRAKRNIFESSVIYGRLQIIKWLNEEFVLKRSKIRKWLDGLYNLMLTSECKLLKIMWYLDEHFNLGGNKKMINVEDMFYVGIRKGHLNVLKWLTERFNISKSTILEYSSSCGVLYDVIERGNVEMAQWLVDRFEIKKKDVKYVEKWLINYSLYYGGPEIKKWYKKTFGIRRTGLKRHYNFFTESLEIY